MDGVGVLIAFCGSHFHGPRGIYSVLECFSSPTCERKGDISGGPGEREPFPWPLSRDGGPVTMTSLIF